MRTRSRFLSTVLLGAALTLSACGGGADATDGDTNGGDTNGGGGGVVVATTEFKFTPDAIAIAADTDVTVTVDNSKGLVEHDFTVEDEDVKIAAAAGKTADGVVNLPAGEYTVFCSVPGHREGGMEATLTVE